MKYIIPIILFFTAITFSFAQDINGEITYKVSQNEEFKNNLAKSNRASTGNLLKGLNENLSLIELSLKFSPSESWFTIGKVPMKNSGRNSMLQDFAVNIAHTGDYNRIEGNDDIFYQPKSFYDADFIVKYQDFDWTLNNETIRIGKYLCYKAISNKTVKNTKGEFNHTVIAWYCPDIPVKYGPARYGGLPGLILKVNDGELIYEATNINLTKERNFEFPRINSDLRQISDQEYNDILLEKIQGIK